MKVLVVEDNKPIVDALCDIFNSQKDRFEVMVAYNGASGLEKYDSFKPDVVLLDIAMPVMDGIETLEKMIQLDINAKVIMVTAASSHERMEKCLKIGASAFIEKPFNTEQILSTINSVLIDSPEKRNVMAAFSRAASKMENSISKIIERNVSVALKDTEIHSSSSQQLSHLNASDIRTGINIAQDEKLKITMTDKNIGFTSKVSQKQNSKIISIIDKQSLNFLFLGKESESQVLQNQDAVFQELFNILHNNISSEISDTMHIELPLIPVQDFDSSDPTINNPNFLTVNFEIISDGKTIPLTTYLWI